MAWVRIEDAVTEHRKHLQAGPAACWLWVCGIAYCQRQLSDGFIPDEALPLLGVLKGTKALAARLVAVRLFDRVEGGYRVHDYHDYNDTREVAIGRKRANQEMKQRAGRLGGLAKAAKQNASRTLAGCQPSAVAKPSPIPSHPLPSHASLPTEPEAKRRARDNGAKYSDDRLRIPDWLDADLARMHPSYDRMGFYLRLSQSLGDEPQDQSDPRLFALWVKQRFCAETGIPPPEVQAQKALSVRGGGSGKAAQMVRMLATSQKAILDHDD